MMILEIIGKFYNNIHIQSKHLMNLYVGEMLSGLKVRLLDIIWRVDETSFGLTTELLSMVHGMPDDRADSAINWKIICSHK